MRREEGKGEEGRGWREEGQGIQTNNQPAVRRVFYFANDAYDATTVVENAHLAKWPRTLLAISIIPFCWLAMMVVHELGHVVTAWVLGVPIEALLLHPLALSRTDLGAHPGRLAAIWGGPLLGVALPVFWWLTSRFAKSPEWFVARFFAGFCLIANGAYLGVGWIDSIGDAGDLIRMGSPVWTLIVFGVVTVPTGFALWNGLAREFGLGKDARPVKPGVALGVFAALCVIVITELAIG